MTILVRQEIEAILCGSTRFEPSHDALKNSSRLDHLAASKHALPDAMLQ